MVRNKNILVITTTSVEGLRIKQYLKPVTAHIVAGTNLFNDFFASFSDVFGGRSNTYQKQLASLYNEAIEQLKYAASDIGANCVIGLSIDIDEISGKGKSMFMITAIGTAVVLEQEASARESVVKSESVSLDKIIELSKEKSIIEKADSGSLLLSEEVWNFITENSIIQVFPFLLKKFSEIISNEQLDSGSTKKFYQLLIRYVDRLPEHKKIDFLFNTIKENPNEQIIVKISELIKELNLFDSDKVMELLKNEAFNIQKRGVQIAKYNKASYNKEDIQELSQIKEYIIENFKERGKRTTKKQLLSSKEKEVWICECGRNNEIESHCSNCNQDIYGFKTNEIKPLDTINSITRKIELISDYLK